MRTVRTVAELRAELAPARPAGDRIGLVPTMGDFHDGHLALIRRARADCDVVVVSLFVNPTQFGPSEDLDTYPRDETRDDALAAAEGVDVLFAPAPEEVYPPGFQTSVEVTELTGVLEGDDGARGRGHLRGVATVCAKLFNMVAPDVAYFGQKDAQQVLVVRRLVRDLDMPLTIEVLPTVREADGLAMSSRNANLSPEERARATALARALRASETAVAAGAREREAVLGPARAVLAEAAIEPDYLELRSTVDLSPVDRIEDSALLAVAARFERARLIDNTVLEIASAAGAEAAA